MSEAECHTADWYQSGFNDGLSARGEKIDQHYSACSEYQISVDQKQYRNGYRDGLRRYCTPVNGWNRGYRVSTYSNFCAQDLEKKFLTAYSAGKKYKYLINDINRLNQEKIKLEELVVSDDKGLTKDEKLSYLHDISELDKQLEYLNQEERKQRTKAERKGWIL